MTAGLQGSELLDRLSRLAETARSDANPAAPARLAWSGEHRAALDLVAGWVDHPRVEVTLDAVGSLIAEIDGTDPDGAALVTGSHIDTVVNAGALDGAYGVVAAFSIVSALARSGERLTHPVRAVAWANEEGVVAPPFTGSAVAAGEAVDLTAPGPHGRTLGDRLAAFGCGNQSPAGSAWPPVGAYLELHVEQGPVLDRMGVPIGVVTGITGSRRGWIRFTGQANHAGTTPMQMRSDAVLAAARAVLAVDALSTNGPAATSTVGCVEVAPGNINVIAGDSAVSFDIRSTEAEVLQRCVGILEDAVVAIARSTSTRVTVTVTESTDPVRTDPLLRRVIAGAASDLGLGSIELASGAGHDALKMASLGPVGMIFVPSIGGISHNQAEATDPADLVAGAQVLLETLRRADREIPASRPSAGTDQG